jgi:hypothetical protein
VNAALECPVAFPHWQFQNGPRITLAVPTDTTLKWGSDLRRDVLVLVRNRIQSANTSPIITKGAPLFRGPGVKLTSTSTAFIHAVSLYFQFSGSGQP